MPQKSRRIHRVGLDRVGALARSVALGVGWVLALQSCSPGPDEPRPTGDSGSTPTASWQIVAEQLPGGLFSVAGTSADDVWVAGADRRDGAGPTLLHWDGRRWTTHETGLEQGDLLWVSVVEGEVFAVGSGGVVLRSAGAGVERMNTPGSVVLWGVWGARTDEVWAVGGEASGGLGSIFRFDGVEWSPVVWTEFAEGLPEPSAWYKVWGLAADDVWFCGTDGALLHWDGTTFSTVDSDTTRTLLTIHGRADGSLTTAVGGQFTATLVSSEDGGPFRDVSPETPPLQMFGVFHAPRVAYAVGIGSFILSQQGDGPWQDEETDLLLFYDLHGVWIDPDGGVWAAGGQVVSPPYTDGALVYKGEAPPQTYEPD